MNMSDSILAHPVELTDDEMDMVSAGALRQSLPIQALLGDIKDVEERR